MAEKAAEKAMVVAAAAAVFVAKALLKLLKMRRPLSAAASSMYDERPFAL